MSLAQSIVIGVVFCVLIMIFHEYLAYIFTTSFYAIHIPWGFVLYILVMVLTVDAYLSFLSSLTHLSFLYILAMALTVDALQLRMSRAFS